MTDVQKRIVEYLSHPTRAQQWIYKADLIRAMASDISPQAHMDVIEAILGLSLIGYIEIDMREFGISYRIKSR